MKRLKDITLFLAIILGIITTLGLVVMSILADMGFRWGCI